MGSALLRGVVAPDVSYALYNRSMEKAQRLATHLSGSCIAMSEQEAAQGADVIILALKPAGIMPCMESISPVLASSNPLIISLAAGVSLADMAQAAPAASKLLRLMPNTPCEIGQGASAIIGNEYCHRSDVELCCRVLAGTGLIVELEQESQLHAVIALAGSAPAYFYELLDAMACEGEAMGLSRDISLQLASQAMRGAATLQQVSCAEPKKLRNDVTSPNGATLAALRKLNSLGLKDGWRSCMQAAVTRAIEMENEQSLTAR